MRSLIAIAALALIAAACGDSGEEPAATSPPTTNALIDTTTTIIPPGAPAPAAAPADEPDPGFLIELVHDDGELSLLLARCERPEDVADDWQAWGQALGLPLLVTMPDGTVMPYEQAEQTDLGQPPPRKRHGYLAGRRPRFLTRRKLGGHDNVIVVDFREIIART